MKAAPLAGKKAYSDQEVYRGRVAENLGSQVTKPENLNRSLNSELKAINTQKKELMNRRITYWSQWARGT